MDHRWWTPTTTLGQAKAKLLQFKAETPNVKTNYFLTLINAHLMCINEAIDRLGPNYVPPQ